MYSTQSYEKLAKDKYYPRNFIWEEVTPKSTKVQTLGEKPRTREYMHTHGRVAIIIDGLGHAVDVHSVSRGWLALRV